jgi:NAD(P)-dependent dehydrogenase (short-subunit alcohol dehydrogenase family)
MSTASMTTTLIYGGSGGIGQAIAKRLHQQGQHVHLVGRDAKKLAAFASTINASFTCGDVTHADLFTQATAEAGAQLTGLVYAVGSINLKPLRRLTVEDFQQDYAVNSIGAALAAQAAFPVLKKNGSAAVVFFSSIASQQGFSNHASISMAKAAVNGLTVALAAEFAPHIRVNTIAPSLTNTPLAASLTNSPSVADAIANLHPIPRLGTADDMAALACFLLGDDSSWLTGQVLHVDGGRSTLRPKG